MDHQNNGDHRLEIDRLKCIIADAQAKLAVLDPPKPKPHVCLALPFNWDFKPGLLSGLINGSPGGARISNVTINSGCLTHGMTCAFTICYNALQSSGFTHFGMLHADMRPDNAWIDTLLAEMDRTGADFISAAACIKDDRGLLNMGVQEPHAPNCRRITMAELYDLPETFTVEDTIHPDWWPAFNTGAMLVKVGPWMENFPGFQVRNWMSKAPDGQRHAHFWSEDWDFTAWLYLQGLKVAATRKVLTWHTGLKEWGTDEIHGKWSRDMESWEIQNAEPGTEHPSIARKAESNDRDSLRDYIAGLGAERDDCLALAGN